eukprot:gnl/MRDRNA2_/MRDRNA2_124103_c0_seq1.p1 gnl/MRDRNA2_/MRDRNA2_124103_c0~~gnl/MRDRNA2_/MRDRNA2_124103_c0_seq1.p1  ORF type:complete len:397 (-),score=83.40 gnl/MRDRNA2_/MRDRNA2_124103_c0_seq1:73-1263(-)
MGGVFSHGHGEESEEEDEELLSEEEHDDNEECPDVAEGGWFIPPSVTVTVAPAPKEETTGVRTRSMKDGNELTGDIVMKKGHLTGCDKCIIFVCLAIVALGIILLCEDESHWALKVAFGLLYFTYWCNVFCSRVHTYLRHVDSEKEFQKYLKDLRSAKPHINIAIRCYHTETYTTTDSNGNTTTHTREVTTHRADMDYDIGEYDDYTKGPEDMLAMFHLLHRSGQMNELDKGKIDHYEKGTGEKVYIIQAEFPVGFRPRDVYTEAHYPQVRDDFWRRNTMDAKQEKNENNTLLMSEYTFRDRKLIILSTEGKGRKTRPWWMHLPVYYLASLFLLAIPYRYLFQHSTKRLAWEVVKFFSAESAPSSSQKAPPPGGAIPTASRQDEASQEEEQDEHEG